MPFPAISVVVPTHQRRASLARLLYSLRDQSIPRTEFEIVVVDDGSTDGTREWLSAVAGGLVTRVVLQGHHGPAEARNRGIAEAMAEIVLFLDDDVVADPELLSTHLAVHRIHPDTVVIGPMLPPRGWRPPPWIRWEANQLLAQYRAILAGVYPCTSRQFFTANASVPRARLMQAGGFDAAFARAEDVELGYRLRDIGMRFAFEPEARVWHYPDRTFASWARTPYQYGRRDVAMGRDKGHEALDLAFREFHSRHTLTRFAVRASLGRAPLRVAFFWAVRVAARLGDLVRLEGPTNAALSALFNVLYWQGVTDEMGGAAEEVRRSIDSRARHAPA